MRSFFYLLFFFVPLLGCSEKGKAQTLEAREQLLASKSDSILKKPGLLQELYIRGLVDREGEQLVFQLPFNLHGFGCMAPDCYVSLISFSIPAQDPVVFPEKIAFTLTESGCGFENPVAVNGLFERSESTPTYVNLYTNNPPGNLLILANTRQLYFIANTQPGEVQVKTLEEYFAYLESLEGTPDAPKPYFSTDMLAAYEDLYGR